MDKVRVYVLKVHDYYGKRRNIGEEYDADKKDIELLRELGWAFPSIAAGEACGT